MRNLQRLRLSVVFALLSVFALVGTAFAWPDLVEGKPYTLHPGAAAGHYLWHRDGGFTLAVTGPAHEPGHVYTGVLETNGEFADIRLLRAERPDGYAVRESNQRIRFHFRTHADIDGLAFSIEGGTYLKATLFIDDIRAPERRISLGHRAVHPISNPFTLYR